MSPPEIVRVVAQAAAEGLDAHEACRRAGTTPAEFRRLLRRRGVELDLSSELLYTLAPVCAAGKPAVRSKRTESREEAKERFLKYRVRRKRKFAERFEAKARTRAQHEAEAAARIADLMRARPELRPSRVDVATHDPRSNLRVAVGTVWMIQDVRLAGGRKDRMVVLELLLENGGAGGHFTVWAAYLDDLARPFEINASLIRDRYQYERTIDVGSLVVPTGPGGWRIARLADLNIGPFRRPGAIAASATRFAGRAQDGQLRSPAGVVSREG